MTSASIPEFSLDKRTEFRFSALKADAFKKLHPIEVTGMLADPAYHGHPETTIDKAFEGSHSANYKDCYVSNTNGKAGASIDIEPAKVVQIILLNRKDCCSKENV